MLSRRDFLLNATVAGAGAFIRGGKAALASISETPVSFQVPEGACDCHVHVIGDSQQFPFVTSRLSTPAPASVAELRTLHRALHIERVVVVQPSAYGADNSCMLNGLKQLGSIARGVAVINDQMPDSALDDMQRAGVRGAMVNLVMTPGGSDPAVCRALFSATGNRLKTRPNWHMQVATKLPMVEAIKDLVMTAPMPIVFDHFGGAQEQFGVAQRGFDTLLNLARTGKAYVKLSKLPDFADVTPLAKALIAANPQRILWGSNWPHPSAEPLPGHKFTDITPRPQIDDGRVLNLLASWVPDAAVRKSILVENPARLYGF